MCGMLFAIAITPTKFLKGAHAHARARMRMKYHPKGLAAAVSPEVLIDPKGLQRVSKVSSCVQIQIETKGHAGRG